MLPLTRLGSTDAVGARVAGGDGFAGEATCEWLAACGDRRSDRYQPPLVCKAPPSDHR